MKMNYNQVAQLRTNLYNSIKSITDTIEELKDLIDKLDNDDLWQGSGYENFQNKVSAFHTNFKSYCNELYELPKIINNAIENYKEVDLAVSQTVSTLH